VVLTGCWVMSGCEAKSGHSSGPSGSSVPGQSSKTRLYTTLAEHSAPVLALAFDPTDANRFVSGGQDKTDRDMSIMRIWSLSEGKSVLSATDLPGDVLGFAWSADGKNLMVSTANFYDNEVGALRTVPRVTLWDPARPRRIKTIDRATTQEVLSMSWAPDGGHFALAGMGKHITIWSVDPDSDKTIPIRVLIGHLGNVCSVVYSPDGSRLISGSMDKTIKIWDPNTATKQCLLTLEGHNDSVNAVACFADGKRVVSGSSDKTVKVWSSETGVCRLTLEGHTASVNAVAVTPDGRQVISAGNDGTVRIWNVADGKCLQTLSEHSGPIEALALSSDGKVLLTGGQDRTIRGWLVGRYPD